MKKIVHLLSLVLLSSMSLTSCRIPKWNEEEFITKQKNSTHSSTRKLSNNLIYLHDQIKRYNSAQDAFNSITQKGIVVVDYYADWCGPCRKLGSTLEHVAPNFPNVIFLKVDTDQFKQLSSSVRSIPVLAFYKNGKEVKRIVGLQSKKELTALINSL